MGRRGLENGCKSGVIASVTRFREVTARRWQPPWPTLNYSPRRPQLLLLPLPIWADNCCAVSVVQNQTKLSTLLGPQFSEYWNLSPVAASGALGFHTLASPSAGPYRPRPVGRGSVMTELTGAAPSSPAARRSAALLFVTRLSPLNSLPGIKYRASSVYQCRVHLHRLHCLLNWRWDGWSKTGDLLQQQVQLTFWFSASSRIFRSLCTSLLRLFFSSSACILSLRWTCSRSLLSVSSLSTVADSRELCSSFIFSRWPNLASSHVFSSTVFSSWNKKLSKQGQNQQWQRTPTKHISWHWGCQ